MHNLGSLTCLLLLALADPPPSSEAPEGSAMAVVAAMESALADAIAKAEASVVAIARTKSDDGVTAAIKGRMAPAGAKGLRASPDGLVVPGIRGDLVPTDGIGPDEVSSDFGSGVVVGDKGEILTAFHVVQGARRLYVRAVGNKQFEAEIIAADPRIDLAVIVPKRSTGQPAPTLVPIQLGDAAKLRKGSFLVALGNPFNAAGHDGRPSASWGILSNISRRLERTPSPTLPTLKNYPTLLQLDSKLNLGMSGGAVINLKGELVGLTSNSDNAAGYDAQAGYAIPMDTLGRRAVETLKQGKEFEYGFLGVSLDIEAATNLVKGAHPGTPAAEGELRVDDAIIAVGEIPVEDRDGLFLAINTFAPGSTVVLKLRRGSEILERSVHLAKAPVEGEIIATNRPAPWRGLQVDYTSTLPQADFGSGVLAIMALGGVAVTKVDANSPSASAGLKKNQVIQAVNGVKVRTPLEFHNAVAKATGPVTLTTDQGPVRVE